jgi:hypothetical protein
MGSKLGLSDLATLQHPGAAQLAKQQIIPPDQLSAAASLVADMGYQRSRPAASLAGALLVVFCRARGRELPAQQAVAAVRRTGQEVRLPMLRKSTVTQHLAPLLGPVPHVCLTWALLAAHRSSGSQSHSE